MLVLRVSGAKASHHQGVQVVITDTSLPYKSWCQHLGFASLTLCTLQTTVSFAVLDFVAPSYVGFDTDTIFTCDRTH